MEKAKPHPETWRHLVKTKGTRMLTQAVGLLLFPIDAIIQWEIIFCFPQSPCFEWGCRKRFTLLLVWLVGGRGKHGFNFYFWGGSKEKGWFPRDWKVGGCWLPSIYFSLCHGNSLVHVASALCLPQPAGRDTPFRLEPWLERPRIWREQVTSPPAEAL